ncbi:MAG: hydrolase [Lentisphaerae bacterium RIFOXYB12_FULL_65_16]|nr:MAG: hydrolase [Lentisphaerae bacterium RIFOXYA12_64_32]OGV88962.1 MAG: hydrolase [Lentisphaerae bacterium RIFOXYB12_FULL_65_16]
MRVVDLSHELSPGMPVYPGTEPPQFACGTTLERDGFREHRITMFSHTGTHMDAPAHILPDGPSLDRFAAGHFVGPAILVDVRGTGDTIGIEHLLPLRDRLRTARFLILNTGTAAHWGSPRYFSGFPVLTAEAADWLGTLRLAAVGVDAISVDRMNSVEFPNHRCLMSAGACIVENLTGLDAVGRDEFVFCCLPLKYRDADGSPVRAVALVE